MPETKKEFNYAPFIGVIIITMVIILPLGGLYNGLVQKDVRCEQTKANIQVALQRRFDLIPNLISTIEGSAGFEKSTLLEIVEMRSKATQIRAGLSDVGSIEQLEASENELSSIIGRLLLIYEQYPTLQTTKGFLELQAQLTATENQINVERTNYNTAVMDYKTTVRAFPSNVVAGFFGFNEGKWKMFEVQPGKEVLPTVTFNL